MSVAKITISDLLANHTLPVILDVRSPGEFAHARIPGAISFPLFSDSERKTIGTAFKQISREEAIKIGLGYYGGKMRGMVESAEEIMHERGNSSRDIVVHCWRGGMRSAAVAWLLDLFGFNVSVITGGYKSFRRWVLAQFGRHYEMFVIGGYTGSNKTTIIQSLMKNGYATIDLEAIASHRGSAFGNLGMAPQPTQEQFENILAIELHKIALTHSGNPIFVEGESQRIGNLNLPPDFFRNMRSQPLLFLDIPFDERLTCIMEWYGNFGREELSNAITRIRKRLGGLEFKNAMQYLESGEIRSCFSILLKYYDKYYDKSTFSAGNPERRITYIKSTTRSPEDNLRTITETCLKKTLS